MQLRTLGDLALSTPAGVVKNRRELILLAFLARRRGGRARRDELASLLWAGSEMQRARHSLRQALVELRRWLGDSLDVDGETIALMPGRVTLDLSSFDEAIDRGAIEDAVDLWHGDFLTGFDAAESDDLRTWIESERESGRRRLARAFEALAKRAQRTGERAAVLALCDRWSARLPLDERAHVLAVETLIDMGRHEAAAARYASAVAMLERELGVAPGAALVAAGARVSAGQAAAGLGSAALLAPDLVGRTHAVEELLASWNVARAGNPTVVVIEGETGMGKTRLLLEFLWRVESSGVDACILRARGEPAGDPMSGARSLLDGLGSAPGLAAADPQSLADLSELLPELRQQFRTLPLSDASRGGLVRAASTALREVAAEAPVILVVDDTELLDSASRDS